MRIDIPSAEVERIALIVANHRHGRNLAQTRRDFRLMEVHEQFLYGALLFLESLGPRQRQTIEDKITAALPAMVRR